MKQILEVVLDRINEQWFKLNELKREPYNGEPLDIQRLGEINALESEVIFLRRLLINELQYEGKETTYISDISRTAPHTKI